MHRHAMSVSENIIIVVLAAVFWFLKSPNLMCTRVYVTRKKTAKNSVAEDVALATILSDAAVQKKGRAILFTCVCQIRNSKANNQSLAQAFRSSLRDNGSCSTICFLKKCEPLCKPGFESIFRWVLRR